MIAEVPAHDAPHAEVESHGAHAEVEHLSAGAGDPERWGWHHEFRLGRQVGGWMTVIVLGLLLTTTHYNGAGSIALIVFMVLVAGGLVFDLQRRRTEWRS